jgi:hypothetical protein
MLVLGASLGAGRRPVVLRSSEREAGHQLTLPRRRQLLRRGSRCRVDEAVAGGISAVRQLRSYRTRIGRRQHRGVHCVRQPVEYVRELSANLQVHALFNPEDASEIHVFCRYALIAVVVVVGRSRSKGSRRRAGPCLRVQHQSSGRIITPAIQAGNSKQRRLSLAYDVSGFIST